MTNEPHVAIIIIVDNVLNIGVRMQASCHDTSTGLLGLSLVQGGSEV